MPALTAGPLLVALALGFAVLSLIPPLPGWLVQVAVVLLCVAWLVGR